MVKAFHDVRSCLFGLLGAASGGIREGVGVKWPTPRCLEVVSGSVTG